jgi:hypothetical protein
VSLLSKVCLKTTLWSSVTVLWKYVYFFPTTTSFGSEQEGLPVLLSIFLAFRLHRPFEHVVR